MEDIKAEPIVGLSMEGATFGRHSLASIMSFATSSCPFLFDMYTLGDAAFDNGLRDILESEQTEKVIHNCRIVSDYLYHRHGITICGVFDTQVSGMGKLLKGMFGNTDLTCCCRRKILQCALDVPSCFRGMLQSFSLLVVNLLTATRWHALQYFRLDSFI